MKWSLAIRLWFASSALVACGDDGDDPGLAQNREPEEDASVATKVSNAGIACSLFARQCEGAAAQCLEISFSGAFYPGGYCTADCRTSAECGLDAVCPVGEAQRLTPSYHFRSTWARKCFKTCVPSDPQACRPGYACMSLADAYEAPDSPTPMHTPICLPRVPTLVWDAGAQRVPGMGGRWDAGSAIAVPSLDAGRDR